MNDLKQALENAGVDELELAKQRIISLEETVKELEFDCALYQRQLSDLGQKFAKITNRPFKKPFVKKTNTYNSSTR
jgi:hypothetical protein|tara:strand:+ start:2332 stop:2559 length:228 start_codon:yes stop_codon:yes gene_type:complete